MGTITTRKAKDGSTRYRAAIRINKQDLPTHSESKTFSKKSLAEAWIKKREYEIEANPEILTKKADITFKEACENFLNDVGGNFGYSRYRAITALSESIIANKKLSKLSRVDFNLYADNRLADGVKPQTLSGDLVHMRAVLKHAHIVHNHDINLAEFETVVMSLRYLRKVAPSDKRTRLPTNDELQALTTYFYQKFTQRKTGIPFHLLLWFAIYTGRRQAEFTKMRMSDYRDGWWVVRDSKSPTGSKGNHIKVKITQRAQNMIPLFLELKDIQKSMFKNFDEDLLLSCSAKSIGVRFIDACKILGIDDLHFHDLRHECATRLAEQGLSIPQIQQVTGHQSWSSLQIYVNMQPRRDLLEFDEAMKVAVEATSYQL